MGVNVDEAGRHHLIVGIDGLTRRLGDATDLHDQTVANADIGWHTGAACAVNDRSPGDNHIQHEDPSQRIST